MTDTPKTEDEAPVDVNALLLKKLTEEYHQLFGQLGVAVYNQYRFGLIQTDLLSKLRAIDEQADKLKPSTQAKPQVVNPS